MRSDNNNNFRGTNTHRRRHKNHVAETCHVFTQDYLVASRNDTHNVSNCHVFTQDYLVATRNDTHNVSNFEISAYVN